MGLTAGSRDPHARASCWSVTPRRRATPRGDAISLARCATSGCYETRYWQRAASEYARHHDNAFAELRAAERLCAELFLAIGSEADAARARLASAIDDSDDADINRQGPEMPRAALESYLSNAARQRLAASYQLA